MKQKLLTFFALISLATFGATLLPSDNAHAAVPPDSCFQFSAGTIQVYYNNQANNGANPACPKNVDIPATIGGVPVTTIAPNSFWSKDLVAVTIPNGVTSIGQYAFYDNNIATVFIPSSVTTIGQMAFYINNLSSVSLPEGLITLESLAFAGNSLTSVTLPSSLTSLGQWVFAIQTDDTPAYTDAIYANDAATTALYYDTLRYTRVYTANGTNPHNFLDDAYLYSETDDTTDYNGDGSVTTGTKSFGGGIINPASATINYQDGSGSILSPSLTSVGELTDGTNIPDYLVSNGPSLPAYATPNTPTPADIQAIDQALDVYYKVGQSSSFTAPAISGYTLQSPSSPATLALNSQSNTLNFVYLSSADTPDTPGVPSTSSGGSGSTAELADTGMSTIGLSLIAISILCVGFVIFRKARSMA